MKARTQASIVAEYTDTVKEANRIGLEVSQVILSDFDERLLVTHVSDPQTIMFDTNSVEALAGFIEGWYNAAIAYQANVGQTKLVFPKPQ